MHLEFCDETPVGGLGLNSSQFSSVTQSCPTLRPHGLQHTRHPCPSPTPGAYSNSCPLSQWCHPTISNLCHPLLLLPSIFPSIRVFSNQSALHIRWPKYWSFSFNISPSNEYSGLISFRMDWLDLLAVQGTVKSLLQHHSSKASILWHSASFTVQLSHPYMTAGKTIALTRRTFVGKVMSLLFNMLSRLAITFLPRSKHYFQGVTVPYCTTLSWLLLLSIFNPSLPWLATVWICPLDFREGQRGWVTPISYRQEPGDMERICAWEGPTADP